MKLSNTIKKMPKGLKASIAFFIANIVTAGIKYITTPFFTRLLSIEEFGVVSVYLTWEQVFGIIAMFCLSYGIFNNGMSDFPEQRDEFSFSMLGLSNIITVIFAIILFLSYPYSKNIIQLDYPLLILMVLIFLFQPAYKFWTVRQRYEYEYKKTVVWTIVCAFLSPAIAILCIYVLPGNRIYSRLFGSELTLLAIYIGFFIYLGRKSHWKCDRRFWKDAILFNLPLIPHYLSTYILASSDKIMISNLCGNADTAFYTIAYSIASVGTIVWSAANASLVPYTYEKCKTKDYKSISNVTIPILIVYGVVCFMVILMAPEIVSILATAEYKEAIYAVPPVIAGLFFQVHYYMYANVLYYYKKPKYVMIASLTATALNLVLNYVFIQKYGYLAAGYTTLICYLVQAVIDFLAMRKVVGESVYDMKLVTIISVILIAICLASTLLYSYVILRYFILAAILLLCYIFRKRIIRTFTDMKKI